MVLIQFIFLLFFIFAFGKVLKRYIKKDLALPQAIMWGSFWVAAGVVILIPDSSFFFARALGVTRGADVIVYVTLAFLAFIVFRLTIKIEQLDKKLTLLVRKDALEEKK